MADTNQSAAAVLSPDVRADNSEIMRWITLLPEVGDPLLSKRRAIIELVAQAERLEALAQARRAEAYRASLELEASARRNWSDDEIERAKQRTR
ncbi:stable inheritance protein KleA [Denitromonas sp.]|jgi:hypothetical protein|uniref:stable inheritance protein KleA n=1 Tax=Denitromonas sp. TaxID=2734609 RepID=UPI002B0020BE|nr:stable inheritance protein KleA [Denitromonas sp.]